AVRGKARRRRLRGRPPRIRRGEGQQPIARPARTAPAAAIAEQLTREVPPPPVVEAPASLPPLPAEAPPVTAGKITRGSSRACSWPVGDPKPPGFHFCGDDAIPGR